MLNCKFSDIRKHDAGLNGNNQPAPFEVNIEPVEINMRYIVALKKFFKDQDGASMAEYAVLLAVVTIGTIGALQLLSTAITTAIDNTAAVINP